MSLLSRSFLPVLVSLPFLMLTVLPAPVCAQQQRPAAVERALRHGTPLWATVAEHLPDPAVATEAQLELAADVLRARRFPEDALEFYGYALKRGGDESRIMTKMGVTEIEINNIQLARAMFQHVTKVTPKHAEAWNNLGATEYLQRSLGQAIKDYKKAVKLNPKVSTFHSNLGTAYFEDKDYKRAREQFATALALDPEIFQRKEGGGVTAHVLSPADRGRFCFELAKLSLSRGDEAEMLHWLAKASEDGFDLRSEMGKDPALSKYRDDPRVTALTQNYKALKNVQVTSLAKVPDLKPEPAK